MGLDGGTSVSAGACGCELESVAGNEDVALRRGAHVVVCTDASRRHSGRLVSSLHMFRVNPHLASFQHSDIAGLPLDWHQRIRSLAQGGSRWRNRVISTEERGRGILKNGSSS